jgi:hypothetical protein
MKFKSIKQKLNRNKILIYLLFLGVVTSMIGVYYNTVRESKTTYNYAVKDGPNKDYRLFFTRNSDLDEDKKVVEELFRFNYGTIINLHKNSAYFITNSYGTGDKVLMYDFSLKESKIIYDNQQKFEILDSYLDLDNKILVVLTTSDLIKINLENLETQTYILNPSIEVNEIILVQNDKLVFGFDNCKFNKMSCKFETVKNVLVVDLNSKEEKIEIITDNNNEYLKDLPYFGTNKAFKKGLIGIYQNDKGNRNFTLRVFTRF